MPEQVEADARHPRRASRATTRAGRTRSSGTACARSPTATRATCGSRAATLPRHHLAVPGAARARPPSSGSREAVLDGEIVAFDEDGRPELRAPPAPHAPRLRGGRSPSHGRQPGHLRALRPALPRGPLARRAPLHRAPQAARGARARRTHLADARHHRGEGEALLRPDRRRRGSRASSPSGSTAATCPGRRSRAWLKVKNTARQELVIGGWLPGRGPARGDARLPPGRLLRGRRRRARASLRRPGRHRLHRRELRPPRRAARAARRPPRAPSTGRQPPKQADLRRAPARRRGRVPRVDRTRARCAPPSSRACAPTSTRRRSCSSGQPPPPDPGPRRRRYARMTP